MSARGAEIEAVDVRVIRQSMRCFWFGAAGLAPGVGIGLAVQALRLFRKVGNESGDTRRWDFPIAVLGIALAINPMLQVGLGWPAAICLICGLAVVYGIWAARRLSATAAAKWNPARAWAWGGAAMAAGGLGISAALLEMFYVDVFGRMLLGVR